MRVLQFNPALDDPGEYCCDQMRYQMVGTCRGAEKHTTNTEQCPKQMVTFDARLGREKLNERSRVMAADLVAAVRAYWLEHRDR